MPTAQGTELLSSIDPEYTNELVVALEPETDPVMMRLFHDPTRDVVTSTSGVSQYIPIQDLTPSEKTPTKIAFDASPEAIDQKVERSSWKFDGKFSHEATTHLIDLKGGNLTPDMVHEQLVRTMLVQLAFKIDMDGFAKVLTETTINQTLDVQAGGAAAWKDNNAPIMEKLEDAMDLTKGIGDLLVIGDNAGRKMSRNLLFRDRDAHIIAADGSVTQNTMAAWLSARLGIDVVVLTKRWYKDNIKGGPANYQQLLTNHVGLYSRDHIRTKRLSFAEEFFTEEYDKRTQCRSAIGHKYVEFERIPEAEGGVVFTNLGL